MVEISSKEYWKTLNYYDALLYCQLLTIDGKDGWRMIREEEYLDHVEQNSDNSSLWFYENGIFEIFDDLELYNYKDELIVIPVREL